MTTLLTNVSIDELQRYLVERCTEKAAMRQTNLTWLDMRRINKINILIKEVDAIIWYQSNIGNIRGLIDRLPSNEERRSLWHMYNKYNILLRDAKLPSTYTTGLVPGLNARYLGEAGGVGDGDEEKESSSDGDYVN
jgi:hypothetical protein